MGEREVTIEREILQLLNIECLEEEVLNGTLTATKKDNERKIVQGCITTMITLVKRDNVKMFN
jgi:hypothetical protein